MKTHSLQTQMHTQVRVQGGGTLDGALKFMCEWKLWGCFCCDFYRVPVALGKSQGRACIPLILHMLLTSRKTTASVCVCVNQDMSCLTVQGP